MNLCWKFFQTKLGRINKPYERIEKRYFSKENAGFFVLVFFFNPALYFRQQPHLITNVAKLNSFKTKATETAATYALKIKRF